MKRICLFLALTLVCLSVSAKSSVKGPSFKEDGTLKILQITDTHIRTFNTEEAAGVYARIDHMVKTESPDLIVLTGDIVLCRPAKPEWEHLVSVLDSYRIPWCVMFGNHDAEQDLTRPEMSKIIAGGKYTMNTLNEAGELADVEIPVKSASGSENAFYVFCMDSHDYRYLEGVRHYAWFTPDQVQWLRDCCTARTDADGKVAPSMAFFHIPLREYIDAWAFDDNPREESSSNGQTVGIRGEKICAGGLNSGMFSAMVETGSVIATSCGHDHYNDFNAAYHRILLCYGRYTGNNTTSNGLPHGAKIFRFFEGSRTIESWVREDDDRIMHHCMYDGEKITNAKRDRALPYGVWHDIDIKK